MDRIDGQLGSIAQRENITKGGVLARVEDVDGLTLLHVAAEYGKDSVLDYYFRDGVFVFESGLRDSQLSRKTKSLDSPIHMAARIGQAEFIKALVSRGVSVDSKGAFGATALHFAALEKNDSLVKDLIGMGANLNTQTMSGQTALHIAAQNDDVATATLLLNNGANPNIRNAGDLKPVQDRWEPGADRNAQTKALLDMGADAYLRNAGDLRPEAAASVTPDSQIHQLFIQRVLPL
ncbi:hypothetical protein DL770_010407 [Monosporascus sp. CRB-9-2]|nr:hypothetical protein DL770_010407 [Monosporascus sp. CRB-9-2]